MAARIRPATVLRSESPFGLLQRDQAWEGRCVAGARMVTANPEPTDTPDPDRPAERPLRYRGRRLDGPIQQFHAAVDALDQDTVPYTYYAKVLAGRDDRAAAER